MVNLIIQHNGNYKKVKYFKFIKNDVYKPSITFSLLLLEIIQQRYKFYKNISVCIF
jgi:hypothetical protein